MKRYTILIILHLFFLNLFAQDLSLFKKQVYQNLNGSSKGEFNKLEYPNAKCQNTKTEAETTYTVSPRQEAVWLIITRSL